MTERAICDYGDPMLLTPGDHSVFDRSLSQMVKDLIADERTLASDLLDCFKVRHIEVAHAPAENLPLVLKLLEGSDRLLQWVLTAPVQQIRVQPIGMKSSEGFLTGYDRPSPRSISRKNLGNQENPIALSSDRLCDHLLGAAVHLCRVDVGHAEIESLAQSGDCRGAVTVVDVPGSLTDRCHLALRGTKSMLFHTCPPD